MQLSQQYHQQRRLQQIAVEQKEAEARHFNPDRTYDSFTLTEADEIHAPVASRAPAQAQ
ncbi:MAG: hypothetical protein K2Q26_10130 [Bdellovibrionales bacterium]|nr:hypothetical protein [Bdellovibrionales bacterium]